MPSNFNTNLSDLDAEKKSVFTPYSPIGVGGNCYGRKKEINRIKQSILEEGKHIVLFGERGSGKTSLANIAYKSIKQAIPVSVVCSQLINQPEFIWQMVLEKLQSELENSENDGEYDKLGISVETLKHFLTEGNFKLNRLVSLFNQLKFPLLIVLDEVDLLTKNTINLTSLAETIKAFSDQVPRVTLLLIGIGNKSNDLISEHISLERCLMEIKIERLTAEPLLDILEGGLNRLGMNMLPEVKKLIVEFSEGLPFYIHLVAEEAVSGAQALKYQTVVKSNYDLAVRKIIEDRQHSLETHYKKAISFSKNNFYQDILKAAVLLITPETDGTPTSPHINQEVTTPKEGVFTAREILNYLLQSRPNTSNGKSGEKERNILLKSIQTYLNKACTPSKGEILKKQLSESHRERPITEYSFKSPLIRNFILSAVE